MLPSRIGAVALKWRQSLLVLVAYVAILIAINATPSSSHLRHNSNIDSNSNNIKSSNKSNSRHLVAETNRNVAAAALGLKSLHHQYMILNSSNSNSISDSDSNSNDNSFFANSNQGGPDQRRRAFIYNAPVPHACADFNIGASAGASAGLLNVFTCPADGFQRIMCSEEYPVRKDLGTIKASTIVLNDIAFFILLGPNSKTDAFYWWLPLITEPTDIVLVADACPNNAESCDDSISKLLSDLQSKFSNNGNGAKFHIARVNPADSGYQHLSCKLRTGAKKTLEMFPNKKFYFKFDGDTLIFPKRFMQFIRTLDAVADYTQKIPIYFGTIVESGMNLLLCGRPDAKDQGNLAKGGLCYGQGGAGYGLDKVAMKLLADSPSCQASAPDAYPEDTYTAMRVFSVQNTSVIHCGSFSSSELIDELKAKHAVTFHYIDSNWLRSYGEMIKKHLHNDANHM